MADISFDDLIPQAGAQPAAPATDGEDQAPINPATGKPYFIVHMGQPKAVAAPATPPTKPQLQEGAGTQPSTAISPAAAPAVSSDISFDDLIPKTQPSVGESAGLGVGKGIAAGYSPELTGLAAAGADIGPVGPFGPAFAGGVKVAAQSLAPGLFGTSALDTYQQAAEQQRRYEAQAEAANPRAFLGGQIGGGLLGAVASPALAPFAAETQLGRGAAWLGNQVLPGAVYGGIAGSGEAGPGNRLQGAVQGGLVGGALAPVAGAIGAGIGAGSRALFGGGPTADQLAQAALQRRIAQDQLDLQAVASRMEQARAMGQPLTPADIAGQGSNVQALAGNVARLESQARQPTTQLMQTRQVGDQGAPSMLGDAGASSQADRINSMLGSLQADSATGRLQTADDIIARRQQAAAPDYAAANATPIDYGSSGGQALTEALKRVPSEAMTEANKIIAVQGGGGHQIVWQPNAKGEMEMTAMPNVSQVHNIREGLDEMVQKRRDAFGRLSKYGYKLQGLRREIDQALGQAVPAIKAADAKFAGESRLRDALIKGEDAFDTGVPVERVQRDLAALKTEGEREMYRHGALDKLKQRVAAAPDTSDKTKLVLGSPAMLKKLNAIVPAGPARERVMQGIANERAMFQTRQALTGGSQTAERLADIGGDQEAQQAAAAAAAAFRHGKGAGVGALIGGAAGHPLLGMAVGAAMAGHWPTVFSSLARVMSQVNPENRARVLEAVHRIVLTSDPEAVKAFADTIRKTPMPAGVRRTVVGTVMNALPRRVIPRIAAQGWVAAQPHPSAR